MYPKIDMYPQNRPEKKGPLVYFGGHKCLKISTYTFSTRIKGIINIPFIFMDLG